MVPKAVVEKRVSFKGGVPYCACGSHKFVVYFREVWAHDFDALGSEWGESEPSEDHEGQDPIVAVLCHECDADLALTDELVRYILADE